MALPENGSQIRAAVLLQPETTATRPLSGSTGVSFNPSMNEKSPLDPTVGSRGKSCSLSSNGNTLASSGDRAAAEVRDAQRLVRTIPTWVRSVEEEDDDAAPAKTLILHTPAGAQLAHHNHTPSNKHKSEPGRLFDSQRERTPVTINCPVSEYASRWQTFAKVSAYPPISAEGGQQVDEGWLREHLPDLEQPWHVRGEDGDPEKDGGLLLMSKTKRKAWHERAQRTLIRSPIVPLILRLIVWSQSIIALGIAGSIYHRSRKQGIAIGPSTLMAIVFEAIAVIYLLYIMYDEYSGKPLGLRSAKAKMRLIFLDLFFIVFDSANLGLAFESLSDPRAGCTASYGITSQGVLGTDKRICDREKALSSVLLLALIAWLLTFGVSVFRLVERIART
ncbi:MAG: hypothetical protein M1827_005222 [Pycnora praestabilis]|nr:MAG: hypothetical protein M1827_005222 [Pycnora praestabilis]